MTEQIGRHSIRVRGRTVRDGGMLWLCSSLSEAGFRVTGAKHLKVVLQADDSVLNPARGNQTPRYEVLVDGDTVIDARMSETEETITVFDSGKPWGAEIRIRKLSECSQSILAIREIRVHRRFDHLRLRRGREKRDRGLQHGHRKRRKILCRPGDRLDGTGRDAYLFQRSRHRIRLYGGSGSPEYRRVVSAIL